MKALTWQGREKVSVDHVPDPRIEVPTDAVIQVTSAAICGSDLHLYSVLGPFLKPGDVLGHDGLLGLPQPGRLELPGSRPVGGPERADQAGRPLGTDGQAGVGEDRAVPGADQVAAREAGLVADDLQRRGHGDRIQQSPRPVEPFCPPSGGRPHPCRITLGEAARRIGGR